jgi:hypothetical protein
MAWPGFDAARYVEDVIKPIQQGWAPTRNFFRVYQLSPEASQADVQEALDVLARQWSTPELRQHGQACERLRACHPKAAEVLGDRDLRADHRTAVDREHRALVNVVRHRLHGAPGMTATAIAMLVRQSAGRWSRPDVMAALAVNQADECAPAELPAAPEPKRWSTLLSSLPDVPHKRLWDYLTCAPGLAGVATTATQIEARRQRLRASRGFHATAETTVLKLVELWLDEPGLAAVLRHEMMSELAAEALLGYRAVRDLASADPERCATARLPHDPDVLAYAVWCARTDGAPWERDYAEAIVERRLTAALAVLNARPLPRPWIGIRDNLHDTVDRLTGELARARELEDDSPEDAAAAYLAIGRELSDPAIEAGLLRCRALAPEQVTAHLDDDQVVVTWTPSRSTAGRIGYRVERGAAVLVVDTAELSITDSPPVAVPCVYTVSTTRDGVPGEAATSAEVTVLPEVQELAASAEPAAIRGQWRLPPEASGVLITRTDSAGTVVTLPAEGQENFVDYGVLPGARYFYLVRAAYPTPTGTRGHGHSAGLWVSAECPSKPVPVTDLRAVPIGDEVDLGWTPPRDGHVTIHVPVSGVVPPLGVVPAVSAEVAGRVVAAERAGRDRHCVAFEVDVSGRVVAVEQAGRARVAATDLDGERVLIPVTVLGAWAAIGQASTIDVPLQPVTGLRAERFGPQVQLRWQWPRWAQDARVLWRIGTPLTSHLDCEASAMDVSRVAYASRGVRLRADRPGEYWFGVCMMDRGQFGPMETVVSRGRPEARYTVQRIPWFRHGTHLVTVDGVNPLPEVVIVAKSGARPLALEDGIELGRLPGGEATSVRRLSVPEWLQRPVFLRAFALDEVVLLRHPDPRDLIVQRGGPSERRDVPLLSKHPRDG